MSLTREDWEIKKKNGLARFLVVDGILFTGGPFAVILQVVGYFLFAWGEKTFGQYFTDSSTWITFMLHGTLFGGIMGLIKWRRYQAAFPEKAETDT